MPAYVYVYMHVYESIHTCTNIYMNLYESIHIFMNILKKASPHLRAVYTYIYIHTCI